MPEAVREGAPLKSGSPHVAFVLLWYPLFTQPFIFREVESLRKIHPLQVYTLYGKNLRHCSGEMKDSSGGERAYGARAIFALCWRMALETFKNPPKVWRLFRRSCLRRWPNLETCGENLWGFCVGLSLGSVFREDGIDFVYAPWPRGAATAAWVGAELAGLPFAIAARGDNLEPADPDLADKMAAASFVRANNAADQARMEASAGCAGKTVLIYNSFRAPEKVLPRKRKMPGESWRILALGRFDVTKGFDCLLRACALLKKHGVNFHLTLAGGGGRVMGLGGLDNLLRGLRQDLALENEVDMPGFISHDQLPSLMAAHDIFAAPCVIDPSGRRDGIPNTVIEAMAHGLPVVSSDVNALPEVVRNGETGLLCPPGDPEALALALEWLCSNPAEAAKFGENGARLIKKMFDPALNALRLSETFRARGRRNEGGPCAE